MIQIKIGRYTYARTGATVDPVVIPLPPETNLGVDSNYIGKETVPIGNYSNSEGYQTTAIGAASHSEGNLTTAVGDGSHSEGYKTIAKGIYSHSEGYQTTAVGVASNSKGRLSYAKYDYSHAIGSPFNSISGECQVTHTFATISSSEFTSGNPMMFSTPSGYVNGIVLDLTKSYLVITKIIAASDTTKCVANIECPVFYYGGTHVLGDQFGSVWYPIDAEKFTFTFAIDSSRLKLNASWTDSAFQAQAFVEIYEFSVQVSSGAGYYGI